MSTSSPLIHRTALEGYHPRPAGKQTESREVKKLPSLKQLLPIRVDFTLKSIDSEAHDCDLCTILLSHLRKGENLANKKSLLCKSSC